MPAARQGQALRSAATDRKVREAFCVRRRATQQLGARTQAGAGDSWTATVRRPWATHRPVRQGRHRAEGCAALRPCSLANWDLPTPALRLFCVIVARRSMWRRSRCVPTGCGAEVAAARSPGLLDVKITRHRRGRDRTYTLTIQQERRFGDLPFRHQLFPGGEAQNGTARWIAGRGWPDRDQRSSLYDTRVHHPRSPCIRGRGRDFAPWT